MSYWRPLGLIIIVFSVLPKASAMVRSQDHKFRLELRERSMIGPRSTLRVRIFPHLKSYKPHGKDSNLSQLSLASESPCKVYKGQGHRVGKEGPILQETASLALDAASMAHPLYIHCGSPVTVKREGRTDFTYRGKIYARVLEDEGVKTLELINVVTLRDYMRGVVPSEVYPAWPMETLKTQAVAARTYAVYHLSFARRYMTRRFWDVDDTIAYQAYTGISLLNRRTNQAVAATEGQILTHYGHVIQAYYHADSGGQTEDAADVWDLPIPYVQGRRETFDFVVADSSWQKSVSMASIQRKLRIIGVLGARQRLHGLSVPATGRTNSGRVRLVRLALRKGQSKDIPVSAFKRVVGNLPSTLFAFELPTGRKKRLVIKGLGSGHGVGMSQQGAAILAGEKGWDYDQILEYYYSETTLCRLDRTKGELPHCYHPSLSANDASDKDGKDGKLNAS